MNRRAIIIACVLLALAGMAQAQSNTTSLQLTVGPEAALTVTTGTTNLATTGTNFTIPYTGTTNFTYQIRTSKTSGTGTITSDRDDGLRPLRAGLQSRLRRPPAMR